MKTLKHNFSNGLSVQRRENGYFYASNSEGNFEQQFDVGSAISMSDEQFDAWVSNYQEFLQL
jgi:hypothetical protein